jgi:hypothetical protein
LKENLGIAADEVTAFPAMLKAPPIGRSTYLDDRKRLGHGGTLPTPSPNGKALLLHDKDEAGASLTEPGVTVYPSPPAASLSTSTR